jgi:UDP-3-O-[3-hydroxymyristoyl] N-acetylglucosamine deacetylase
LTAVTRQKTLASSVAFEGIGVHSGAPSRVLLSPAPPESGIVFTRTDIGGVDRAILAHIDFVAATANATVLRNRAGVEVSTVEHLLAAAAALGIDNMMVDADAAELPILDGSAAPYVEAIERAGFAVQDVPRRHLRILRRVGVVMGEKSATLEPWDGGFAVDVAIRFDDEAIGVQRCAFEITPDVFRTQIAPARTFGRYRDLAPLQARGLALGSSLANTIAVDGDRIVNPEGLRLPDEFVRHKALDVIGDMALAGAPIVGRFTGDQCGHALNATLLRSVLASPDAFTFETA